MPDEVKDDQIDDELLASVDDVKIQDYLDKKQVKKATDKLSLWDKFVEEEDKNLEDELDWKDEEVGL